MRSMLPAVVALVLLATACSEHAPDTSAWCKVAKERRTDFAATNRFDRRALAAYAEVEEKAPPKVRADLRTIRLGVLAFLRGDASYYNGDRLVALERSVSRVNDFLRDACHVAVPERNGGAGT